MPNFSERVEVVNGRVPVSQGYFVPVGANVNEDDLDVAIDIAVPAGASIWYIQAHTKDIRFTLDGTTPTATVGFILLADAVPLQIPVEPESTIKVIEVAASASINYQFGA